MTDALSLRRTPLLVDAGALALIALVAGLTSTSSAAAREPELLGVAILFDATVTAGLAHAWLGVRRGGLPAWTVIPVAALGWLATSLLLPPALAPSGSLALAIGAVVELSVVGLAVVRARRLLAAARAARREGADGFEALEEGVRAVLPFAPALATWVRLEAELWWLAVAGWLRRAPRGDGTFTHHKGPHWSVLVTVLGALSLAEATVVHLVLTSNGWIGASWVALVLHGWGLAWLAGDAHALRLRPSRVDGDALRLSVGVRFRARIPLADIEAAQTGEWTAADVEPSAAAARVFGEANVRLDLRAPARVTAFFRRPREVRRVYVQVDEPARFVRAIGGVPG